MAIPQVTETAEQHIQSIITDRRDLAQAGVEKDEEINRLKKQLAKMEADLEKLQDFLPIVETPMLSFPVYLGDKQTINLLRASIVKLFGRMYDIGDPEKDDKEGRKLARDKAKDVVEACIYDTLKYHLDSMASRHFPEANFRK